MLLTRTDYRSNIWFAILLFLPAIATAAEPRAFRWESGQLRGPENPPAAISVILQLINAEQFTEALQSISEFSDAGPRLRGTLGLAVAGHLANDNPGPALQVAKKWLERANAGDDQDRQARKLLNELDVFQTLDAVVLPWAPNLAGHSWVPAPQLLPARDMVRDGNLQQGRDRIAARKGAAPRT